MNLVNAFEPDAPSRLMLELARSVQLSRRCEVIMVALSRGGLLEGSAARAAAEARVIGSGGAAGFAALVRFFRRIRPDIVHVSLLRPTLVGVAAARLAGVPRIVVTCHGTHEWGEAPPLPEPLVRALYVKAANSASRVVGVSFAVRRELLEAGVKADLLRVISNGVDVERFRPEATDDLEEGGLPPGDDPSLVIGAAGNLREVKSFRTLIEAAELLKRTELGRQRVRIRIWGEGPERSRLEQLIRDLGVEETVRLEGYQESMPRLMRRCDVYVQPSLREAFGLAVVEAMACGVPVVVSDAGGLPELAGEGDRAGGLVFPAGSAGELTACLVKLCTDPVLRARLAAEARRRVLERFTLPRMTGAYMALYDELLQDAPGVR